MNPPKPFKPKLPPPKLNNPPTVNPPTVEPSTVDSSEPKIKEDSLEIKESISVQQIEISPIPCQIGAPSNKKAPPPPQPSKTAKKPGQPPKPPGKKEVKEEVAKYVQEPAELDSPSPFTSSTSIIQTINRPVGHMPPRQEQQLPTKQNLRVPKEHSAPSTPVPLSIKLPQEPESREEPSQSQSLEKGGLQESFPRLESSESKYGPILQELSFQLEQAKIFSKNRSKVERPISQMKRQGQQQMISNNDAIFEFDNIVDHKHFGNSPSGSQNEVNEEFSKEETPDLKLESIIKQKQGNQSNFSDQHSLQPSSAMQSLTRNSVLQPSFELGDSEAFSREQIGLEKGIKGVGLENRMEGGMGRESQIQVMLREFGRKRPIYQANLDRLKQVCGQGSRVEKEYLGRIYALMTQMADRNRAIKYLSSKYLQSCSDESDLQIAI